MPYSVPRQPQSGDDLPIRVSIPVDLVDMLVAASAVLIASKDPPQRLSEGCVPTARSTVGMIVPEAATRSDERYSSKFNLIIGNTKSSILAQRRPQTKAPTGVPPATW
jgi:hypothetical protein